MATRKSMSPVRKLKPASPEWMKAPVKVALIKMIDGVFLLAMTSMTIAAFVMIYTIW